MIDQFESGKKKGVTNVLGFNVELDRWLEDAVHGHYGELETTCQDASRTPVPTIVFSAEHDTWVQHASVKRRSPKPLGKTYSDGFVSPEGYIVYSKTHKKPDQSTNTSFNAANSS